MNSIEGKTFVLLKCDAHKCANILTSFYAMFVNAKGLDGTCLEAFPLTD